MNSPEWSAESAAEVEFKSIMRDAIEVEMALFQFLDRVREDCSWARLHQVLDAYVAAVRLYLKLLDLAQAEGSCGGDESLPHVDP